MKTFRGAVLFLVFFSALILAGCEKDDAGVGLHCCMLQKLCENCLCGTVPHEIAVSEDEVACQEFMDTHSWGCTTYTHSDALEDCS